MSLVKPTVYDLILPLLQVALIIAKWSGLDVPWFWILLPLWGSAVVLVILIVCLFITFLVCSAIRAWKRGRL